MEIKHHTPALKNNELGVVHYWGFRKKYLFLNWQKGKVEMLKNTSGLTPITSEEFGKIYEERNIKEGTERERTYGKMNETRNKILGAGTTDKTGKWSMDFARDINTMDGYLKAYKELCNHYGKLTIEEYQTKPLYKDIIMKNVMPSFGKREESLSDKAFEEKITEEEIKELVSEFKTMPEEWLKNFKAFGYETKKYLKEVPAKKTGIKIGKSNVSEIIKREKELLENIASKKIKIDYKGHVPYGRGPEEEINTFRYGFKKEEEVVSPENKDGFLAIKPVVGKTFRTDSVCYWCGEKIAYVIKSPTEIETCHLDFEEPVNYRDTGTLNHSKCEFATKSKRVVPFDLNFKSGKVTFANYFLDKDGEYLFDLPKEEKYSDKYTLQTLKGRINRQQYLSKTFNSGYAQMGNMSGDVFVSKDKKTIIIGDEPYEDATSEKDKKFNEEFEKNFKKVGNISMGVWRWECADKSELDKYKGHQVREGVEVDVVPGTYEVKHYFDSEGRSGSAKVYKIYSEIKLKD